MNNEQEILEIMRKNRNHTGRTSGKLLEKFNALQK